MIRCPRCQLAHIPEGTSTCVRCGFSLTSGAPSSLVASWPRAGPAVPQHAPIIIVDREGEEDDEADEGARVPRQPPVRRGRRIALAASLVTALGGGAVWFGTSSVRPSDARAPDADGVRSVAPQGRDTPVAVPSPRPTAVDSAPRATPPQVVRRRTLARTWDARPLRRAPFSPPVAGPATPGLLSINATPWGSVFVDGRPVGDTPLINLRLAAGSHLVRVERDGFRSYERRIDVAPGQDLRVTGIVLEER